MTKGTIPAPGVVIQQGVKNADPATETTVNIGKDVILISANETADDGDNVVLLYGKATLTSEGVLSTMSQNYAAIQGSGGDTTADTSITINGGSVTSWFNHAIYQPQAGTVIINGGEIEGLTGIEMRAGTLTVTGGTINATGAYAANANGNGSTVEGAAIAVSQHSTFKAVTADIQGGKITADTGKTLAVVHTVNCKPENITVEIAPEAEINVSQAIVAIGDRELVGDEETGYSVKMRTSGACIAGSIWYETLQDAIAAAKDGDKVVLLEDVEVAGTDADRIVIDKAITIDGLNHTITATNSGDKCRAINIVCDAAVKLYDLTVVAAGERAINVINKACTLTLASVDVTAANYAVNLATSAGAAKVTIKDSNLTGLNVVNVAAPGSTTTITGGKITCNDQASTESYSALALNKEAEGSTVITAEGVTFDIKDDSKHASNQTNGGSITILGEGDVVMHVAIIDYGNGYWYGFETIDAAVAKAQSGDTITLIRDVTASEPLQPKTGVTLDLNGKTFTGTILGTIKMNGGKYYAADGKYMAGSDGYYATTDATFTLGVNELGASEIVIVEGNVSITKEMNTMPNQTITIATGASFTVPAGQTINVLNSTIIVEGTLTIEGTVKLGGTYNGTTFIAGTITAADEDLDITAGVEGYEVKCADGTYSLVKSIVLPDALAGSPAADAIKDAMQNAGVTAIKGYTVKTAGKTEATVTDVAEVLEIFDVTPTVDDKGKLTVTYEFGISKVENKGNGLIEITASVNDGAEIRDGVAVVFYADGAEIDSTLSEDDKTASISVSADYLKGKKITVKASNEVRFE